MTKFGRLVVTALLPAALAAALAGGARAAVTPKTWIAGDGAWNTAGNWSPSGVPTANDGVTIALAVSVSAIGAEINFSSLTIGVPSGATKVGLTISTTIASGGSVLIYKNAGLTQATTRQLVLAGDFTMVSGSSLSHSGESAASISSVSLRVAGTFDLQAGATITVTGRGYRGGPVDTVGFGPGGGGNNTANNKGGGGGGYGGAGGAGAGAGGSAYGSQAAPINMGSGGGGSGNTGAGGAGGGVVIIDAGTMNLNGVIVSSGMAGDSSSGNNPAAGGGGSGGGVFITAGNFTGSGRVDVGGGAGGTDTNGGDGGGGGGGRAAIVITGSGVTCPIVVTSSGGAAGGGTAVAGAAGTLSVVDSLSAPSLTGTPQSSTSILWTWSLTNGATDYQLFSSTGGAMSPPLGAAGSYTTTGLAVNTTVSFYVQARACSSNVANSAAAPTATLAQAPAATAASFTAVNLSSASVAWTANGNPVGVTSFTVVLSTKPAYESANAGNVSLSTLPAGTALDATLAGLDPNTTYYLFVAAQNHAGILTSFVDLSTAAPTLALAVGLQAESFVEVDFSSVAAQWIRRPSLSQDVSSMTAEGYVVEASSTNFGVLSPGGVVSSSATPSVALSTLTVSSPGLITDTTYYFRAGALNWAGLPNWTVLGSTMTRFQVNDPLPGDPPYADISTGSMTASWDRNGNPFNTRYRLEVSPTFDFSGIVTATDTYNLFYSTGGLDANATYYFRVYATTRSASSAFVSLGSTMTWAFAPAPAASPFPQVGASSLTVRWLPNGNPAGVSTYTVVATTSPSYPNDSAGNAVLLSTRPAGSDPMAALTGLAANTTYFLFAAGVNWIGAQGEFVSLGSTATRPAAPSALSFAEVSYSSAVASWSTAGNPLGVTTYTVTLSTVAGYPSGGGWDVALDTVPDAASPLLPVAGLQLNATYFLFVTAVGHAHAAFAAGPSTATRAAAPGPSGGASDYDPVNTTDFTLNWSSGAADPGFDAIAPWTTYYADIALNPAFSPVLASSRTFNRSALFAGLAVNTTYFARVAAYGHHDGTLLYSDFGSSATMAAVPAAGAPTFVEVDFTSATVSWSRNGNPASITTYTVVFTSGSVYPNTLFDNVELDTAPAGTAPSATISGLSSGTTYFLFIRAVNHKGAETSWAFLGSTLTLSSPKTWIGGTGSSWNTAANWSPAGVPTKSDAVTIAINANVSVPPAGPEISFSSLTLGVPSGATTVALTVSTTIANSGSVILYGGSGLTQATTRQWMIAGNFTMVSGSSLTHAPESATSISSVNIRVSGTFELQAGAAINVFGRGYRGGPVDAAGFGPGGGGNSTANNAGGGGGGYGGAGGAGTAAGGGTYGSLTAPIDLGSGGGGSGNTGAGGAGGGVVIIDAGTMILDGVIISSGAAGDSSSGNNPAAGGGGSGGGVFLTAGNFTGSGSIDASGGAGGSDTSGGDGGGGGGGRVSIVVTGSGVTCGVTVTAAAGASGGGTAAAGNAGTFNAGDALASPPGFGGSPLTSSSILWGWSLATGATEYQVMASTGGPVSAKLAAVTGVTTTGLEVNTTASFFVQARACGLTADSATGEVSTLAEPPAAAAPALSGVNASSMTAAWSANGNPLNATSYTVVLSTKSVYESANAGNVSLSTVPSGSALAATPSGLDPNTTYYLFVAAMNHAGIFTAYVDMSTAASTLALPPAQGALQFLSVQRTSVTVAWAALSASPPDASSKTCEGYVLQASSNDFGALAPSGAPVFSSTTFNVLNSTMSVGVDGVPLDLGSTYYFRVASLNHASLPNYTALTRLNFQIQQSTGLIGLGAINPSVTRSSVSTSSMVVVNVGNWPVTLELSADMATVPSSPWTLATSPGVETAALMSVIKSGVVEPPPTAFSTYLTPTVRKCGAVGGGDYAGSSQDCVLIPAGQSRTFWFRFFMPDSSVSLGPETMRVTAQPVYP